MLDKHAVFLKLFPSFQMKILRWIFPSVPFWAKELRQLQQESLQLIFIERLVCLEDILAYQVYTVSLKNHRSAVKGLLSSFLTSHPRKVRCLA